jgi:hypothetical protein
LAIGGTHEVYDISLCERMVDCRVVSQVMTYRWKIDR